VLIVGAGPTGLLLAGDLAQAGVSVVVLDRQPEQSAASRACFVQARTLEQLDARGLAEPLVSTGHAVGGLRVGTLRLDLSGLPSRFPYLLVAAQCHTERLLEQRARSAGARIGRGVEVTGLRQDRDGVEVHARGSARPVTAQYLVGADGADSTVRAALRLPFDGRPVFRSVLSADVALSRPPGDELLAGVADGGIALLAPFGDGWFRVMAWNRLREAPASEDADLSEIRDVTAAVLGDDFGMHDARWMSRLGAQERQVRHYQSGRILLAGDAAHVHSPLTGQGLNTGLQDAANLGWKLAAVVRGSSDVALLETYHRERHVAGGLAHRVSQGALRPALLEPGWRQVIGSVADAAMRVGPLADRAALAVSGLGMRYPGGPHRLAGRRAGDFDLRGGWHRRLYEALRYGGFVLVAASDLVGGAELTALLAQWPGTVQVVVPVSAPASLMLIRPDGYVAWASSDRSPVRRYTGLREALNTWCGPPTGRPVPTVI
jgi:2-polyprenyl-6-methoxyphenol hydroxylase-like FAD-dependent oxidoreductase